jgi:hypothetical protein
MDCDAMLFRKWLPTFQKKCITSICRFEAEKLVTSYKTTSLHNPEDTIYIFTAVRISNLTQCFDILILW